MNYFDTFDENGVFISSEDEQIKSILTQNADKIVSETLAVSYNSETFEPEIARDIEVGDKQVVHYELKRK